MSQTRSAFMITLVFSASSPVIAGAPGKPFGGTPAVIPGYIEAENFDEGPEGTAFHNIGPIMEPNAKEGPRAIGLAYRKTPVELEKSRGTMMLAAIREGEWYAYTVDVKEAGTYDLEAVVAGWKEPANAGTFRIEFDGVDKTGPIAAPNTRHWALFRTVTRTGITLKKGIQTMRVHVTKGNELINLDGFRFIPTPSRTQSAAR